MSIPLHTRFKIQIDFDGEEGTTDLSDRIINDAIEAEWWELIEACIRLEASPGATAPNELRKLTDKYIKHYANVKFALAVENGYLIWRRDYINDQNMQTANSDKSNIGLILATLIGKKLYDIHYMCDFSRFRKKSKLAKVSVSPDSIRSEPDLIGIRMGEHSVKEYDIFEAKSGSAKYVRSDERDHQRFVVGKIMGLDPSNRVFCGAIYPYENDSNTDDRVRIILRSFCDSRNSTVRYDIVGDKYGFDSQLKKDIEILFSELRQTEDSDYLRGLGRYRLVGTDELRISFNESEDRDYDFDAVAIKIDGANIRIGPHYKALSETVNEIREDVYIEKQ